jgi:hypothetical protein
LGAAGLADVDGFSFSFHESSLNSPLAVIPECSYRESRDFHYYSSRHSRMTWSGIQ